MKKATDCSCLCDLAAHNYSDKSKQITMPGFLMPPGKSCNDCLVLASQKGVQKMCRSRKFGGFPGASLKTAAATLPQIWLLAAKFKFSLTNHTFASLPAVPTASTVGTKAPCSLQSTAIWTPAPDTKLQTRLLEFAPAHLSRPLQLCSHGRKEPCM